MQDKNRQHPHPHDAGIVWYDRFDTIIGPLTIAADAHGLRHVLFARNRHGDPQGPAWRHAPDKLADARAQLEEYFAGKRMEFQLALHLIGTPFQRKAWHALADIPYGRTRSYGEQARRIGAPAAVRAVGAANGRNPLPIVLPCHRVIGADGSLTGFGGGLEIKAALLRLEGALPAQDTRPHADLFG